MLVGDPAVPIEMWGAVKDLSGWAVVVWIVVWLTRRWETRMDAISTAISAQTQMLAAQTQTITAFGLNLENHRDFTRGAVASMTSRLERVGEVLEKVADRIDEKH